MAVVDKCSIIGPWRVPTSWRLCNYTCRWSAVKVVLKSSRFSQRVTEYPSKRASMFTGESVLGVFISLPTFILANADFTSANFTLLPSLNLQHLKTTGHKVARYVVLITPFLFVCGLKTNKMWLKHPGRENQKADGNMFCLLISNCIIFMFEVKSSRSGSAEKRSFTFGRCPVLKNENQLCLLQLTSRTLQP